MVKQKLMSITPHYYWVVGFQQKPYPAYRGRGVKKADLTLGREVEVRFHNRRAYIKGVY